MTRQYDSRRLAVLCPLCEYSDNRAAVVSTLGRRRLMESKTALAWQSASESRHFALSRSTITVRQTGRLIGSEVTTLWRYTNLFIIIIIIF